MRDNLRDIYRARSLLRRRVVSRKHFPAAPLRVSPNPVMTSRPIMPTSMLGLPDPLATTEANPASMKYT